MKKTFYNIKNEFKNKDKSKQKFLFNQKLVNYFFNSKFKIFND